MPAYKDKNNKWYVSFRYQDWTGKKVRKVKRGFETRREALEWERRFLLKENGSIFLNFLTQFYREYLHVWKKLAWNLTAQRLVKSLWTRLC